VGVEIWHIRRDGSAEIKGADDTTLGIERCREDLKDQAPVLLEIAWTR